MSTLAIETSTTHGSVAVLSADGAMIFEERFVADRTHSSALFSGLERARGAMSNCEQIVVGLGPGSYAGVRIAISAAMGFGMVAGARLLGLPSVAGLEVEPARYAAIGDARQETFYWSLIESGVCVEGPELVTADELRERVRRAGVPVFASESVASVPEAALAFPSAVRLARWALEGRGITARGELEPIYLREPRITWPKGMQPPAAAPLSRRGEA